MKKKALVAMALVSAVTIGTTPLTSHAAEVETAGNQTNNCYKIFIGQGTESLSQVLKEIGMILTNNGNSCPSDENTDTETPELPSDENTDTETPETPTPPVVENPDTQEPDTDASDETTLSYAEQVVKLANEERAKAGLPALNMVEDITAAANVRAKEIKQSFSHTRPNGSSFSSALKEQGVSFMGSGENIAWGQKTPEQVMNGWMNSSGHRANILNKNYKNIGVGYYQDANGVNYWVQLFTY